MASHDELVAEIPKLEKMSNAARLKLAKKRRQRQLRKYQEWVRTERSTSRISTQSVRFQRSSSKVSFVDTFLLQEAVMRNDLGEVKHYLEKGVNPNISNVDGLTPLHRCCIENSRDLAELLMEYSVDLNARDIEGWTPLHAAAACGNLTMISLLMDRGALLTSLNNDGKMPVDVACDKDIRHVIQQRMLEEAITEDVCQYIRSSQASTMLADLKDSVKNGRSLNVKDNYGASALHVASANGYMEVLEFLLTQEEVDLQVQDKEGWTPFHVAVFWEERQVMQSLAEKGADLEVRDIHGDTAYAISDNAEIRQYILDLKAEFTKSETIKLRQISVQQFNIQETRVILEPNETDQTTCTFVPNEDAIMVDPEETAEVEPRKRSRTTSVNRMSASNREMLKRSSSRNERMIRQKTLEEEDMKRTVSGDMMIEDIGEEESLLLASSKNAQLEDSEPSLSTIPSEPSSQPSHDTNVSSVSSATGTESTSDVAETTLLRMDTTVSVTSQTPLLAGSQAPRETIEMEVLDEKPEREKIQRRKLKSVLKKTPLTPVIQQPETGSAGRSQPKRTYSSSGTKRECCVVS